MRVLCRHETRTDVILLIDVAEVSQSTSHLRFVVADAAF